MAKKEERTPAPSNPALACACGLLFAHISHCITCAHVESPMVMWIEHVLRQFCRLMQQHTQFANGWDSYIGMRQYLNISYCWVEHANTKFTCFGYMSVSIAFAATTSRPKLNGPNRIGIWVWLSIVVHSHTHRHTLVSRTRYITQSVTPCNWILCATIIIT